MFEDDTVAELLTTGKLSELACLALYIMYEKLRGKESRWYEFIKVRHRRAATAPLHTVVTTPGPAHSAPANGCVPRGP